MHMPPTNLPATPEPVMLDAEALGARLGKSTFAAQFPAPVFLDTEGGTHHLDVARLPAPKTWADVVAGIVALATEAHDFKTLVIDTADWLEKLLVDHVCKSANKASIED